jgi:hypothetical protein
MYFAGRSRMVRKTEFEMDFIKYLLTAWLLLYSTQSPALFMPEGFSIKTDTRVESDGGCGVADFQPEAYLSS